MIMISTPESGIGTASSSSTSPCGTSVSDMNGMNTKAPIRIRKMVEVALMVWSTMSRSAGRSRRPRTTATANVRKAPTEEASTGVKKPVYMPPITKNTTSRIGSASRLAASRSVRVERSPFGPASGFPRTVSQMTPMNSRVSRMPGTTPAMNSRPMLCSVSTA